MARQARRYSLRRQGSVTISTSTASRSTTSSTTSSSTPSVFYGLFSDKALRALEAIDRVSGFRIPFAFLSSLRANLQISSSLEDLHPSSASISTTNTPDSLRPVTNMASNPSPLNVSLSASNESLQSSTSLSALDNAPDQESEEIPPLTTFRATTEEQKIDALRLIADGVAQQRQIAAKYIIFRPEILALSVIVLAIVTKFLYKGSTSDLALVGTTWTGCIMAGLIAVRWATSGYIELAEKIGTWAWLNDGLGRGSNEDEILVTVYGDEIIGALVLRILKDGPGIIHSRTSSSSSAKSTSNNKGSSRRKNSSRFLTGVVRAWTVKRRYRQKEIGTGLLEEAVSSCRARGLNGPVFADDHANSTKVLPGMFNGGFERQDKWARGLLERVIQGQRKR